jgi:ATP-dependent DNA helicase RecQ
MLLISALTSADGTGPTDDSHPADSHPADDARPVDDGPDVDGEEARLRRVARDAFGWNDFRPGQLEAMRALLAGRNVLAVMPTGSGKSAIYQVPALLIPGPTVVVSPLIALQRDQVAGLQGGWAPDAVTVNSAQPAGRTSQAWQGLRTGEAEFCFLAPEQLTKPDVVEQLVAIRPSLLVIDEAHCISAWGHDFRPDYLRIGDTVRRLGHPVVAALTATAAPPVREEIRRRLQLDDALEVVHGFDRPNLSLEVRRFLDPASQRRGVTDTVVDLVRRSRRPGLVYTATRRSTQEYAERLRDSGLRALPYHAGLRAAQRRDVHDRFLDGELDVVVATSAFGMGIDKPDVRFVVHAAVPESIDAYYQQIGRAGRDGAPARAWLAYRPEDLGLRRFFAVRRPDVDALREVLRAVRAATATDGPAGRGIRIAQLAGQLDRSRAKVTAAVNLLERVGALAVTGRGTFTTRPGSAARPGSAEGRGEWSVDAVLEQAIELVEAGERVERTRLEMMRGYAETTGCRRQFLLGYFGEQLPGPCGNCDTCDALVDKASGDPAGTLTAEARAAADATAEVAQDFPANARVVHRAWGPGIVVRPEPERVTVLFEQVGYRTLSHDTVVERDLLRRTDE